jgi:hypothetical protein
MSPGFTASAALAAAVCLQRLCTNPRVAAAAYSSCELASVAGAVLRSRDRDPELLAQTTAVLVNATVAAAAPALLALQRAEADRAAVGLLQSPLALQQLHSARLVAELALDDASAARAVDAGAIDFALPLLKNRYVVVGLRCLRLGADIVLGTATTLRWRRRLCRHWAHWRTGRRWRQSLGARALRPR